MRQARIELLAHREASGVEVRHRAERTAAATAEDADRALIVRVAARVRGARCDACRDEETGTAQDRAEDRTLLPVAGSRTLNKAARECGRGKCRRKRCGRRIAGEARERLEEAEVRERIGTGVLGILERVGQRAVEVDRLRRSGRTSTPRVLPKSRRDQVDTTHGAAGHRIDQVFEAERRVGDVSLL